MYKQGKVTSIYSNLILGTFFLQPLTHPHPPPKKRGLINSPNIPLYICDDTQNKNLFTFLSRFTWFRFAGWAFSLGPCFVTIALIFPRYFQELKTIIYHFFSKYNKISSCLSLQWRRQSHKVVFFNSHH